jgi:hypothetical protein
MLNVVNTPSILQVIKLVGVPITVTDKLHELDGAEIG